VVKIQPSVCRKTACIKIKIMNKKYLNLSAEIQNYIEFAISDGKLSSKEIELIKRKANEFGDDPIEVELVLSKIIFDLEEKEKTRIVEFVEIIPKYGLLDSYIMAIKNYFKFNGRASRSEFWFYMFFNSLVLLTILIIVGSQGKEFGKSEKNLILLGLFSTLFPLFSVIPFLSICTRRLHDTNKSGWLMLIPFYNLVLLCTKGNKGTNKYGTDPYQPVKVEKEDKKNIFLTKIKSNTIETIGGTMFAIGATSHEAIEWKFIDFHQLDYVNKWLWFIGGILIVIPKTYKFFFEKN
jgi:uncharacterized membrane protein YhaH (DUF805 family)